MVGASACVHARVRDGDAHNGPAAAAICVRERERERAPAKHKHQHKHQQKNSATCTLARTRARTHTQSLFISEECGLSRGVKETTPVHRQNTHYQARISDSRTRAHARTHARTHAPTRTRRDTRARARAHTHTHTRKHRVSIWVSNPITFSKQCLEQGNSRGI